MKTFDLREELPTQLEMGRILLKRKRGMSKEGKYSYARLEAGATGESTVIEYLRKYGQAHWVVLQNVWLEHFGICECDIALLTSVGLHLIEVKITRMVSFMKMGHVL